MRILGCVAICAALGGCATSTWILPAGPDTYTISERYAPIRGGSDEAKRDAVTKANELCSQQGDSSFQITWAKQRDSISRVNLLVPTTKDMVS